MAIPDASKLPVICSVVYPDPLGQMEFIGKILIESSLWIWRPPRGCGFVIKLLRMPPLLERSPAWEYYAKRRDSMFLFCKSVTKRTLDDSSAAVNNS
jgi:hypothetical protein